MVLDLEPKEVITLRAALGKLPLEHSLELFIKLTTALMDENVLVEENGVLKMNIDDDQFQGDNDEGLSS